MNDPEVQRAADAYLLGLPRTPAAGRSGELLGRGTGSSLEFQEYREYVPGDDIRHLDWGAYGRSDTLMVRLFRKVFGDFRPAHARVLTMLLLAAGALLPQLLYFFDQFNTLAMPQYWITDPFHTLSAVGTGHSDASFLMRLLAAGTLLILAVNARSLYRGIVEIARPSLEFRLPPAVATDQPDQNQQSTPTGAG